MPAIPSSVIDPIWDQFQALIPTVVDTHPHGGHRPRVADRVVFDTLVQVLVLVPIQERLLFQRPDLLDLRDPPHILLQ